MERLRRLIGRSQTSDDRESQGGPFQYTPLKAPSSFRILRLQNSLKGANRDHKELALRGSLVDASIDNPPEYFALSYCWGDSVLCEEIDIDGRSLKITASCASALRRMLRGKLGRYIWVDSICINQSDAPDALQERGLQVAMMDRIYRHAVQVNVHLGDGDAASDAACESLTKLSLAMTAASIGGPHGTLRGKYDRLVDDVLESTPEFPYGKLHGVFRLPWFRRTWVIQEVALAKKVTFYCGNRLIRLEVMALGADFTRVPYSKLDVNASARHWKSYLEYHSRVKDLIRWREEREPTARLTSLLSLLAVPGGLFEATRPEDKVFALYGICKRLGYDLPAPDYQKPVAVVYTEAARAVLHYDKSLELLSAAMESPAWADGLPSWVPNFSGCMTKWSTSNPPLLASLAARESLKASVLGQSEYSLESNGTRLKVKGWRLDMICAVGKPWKMDSHTTLLGGAATNKLQFVETLIECIGSWFDVVVGRAGSSSSLALIEAMVHVLTNNIGDQFPTVQFEDMVRSLAVLVTISAPDSPMCSAILASLPNMRRSYDQEAMTAFVAQCFPAITRIFGSLWQTMYRTNGGYLGMGPYTVTPGDMVVLFQGCATAGIIRPSNDGFKYVGPTYVDGIMGGGLWNSGSDPESFILT